MSLSKYLLVGFALSLNLCLHAEEEPRPVIVVIGDANSEGFGASPGWPGLVAQSQPSWRLVPVTHGRLPLREARPGIPEQLDGVPPAALVLVFLGTQDAPPAGGDLAEFAKEYTGLLDTVAAHPNTREAQVVLVTPVPVVEERLDRWSLERFGNGGGARSARIAEIIRTLGDERDLEVEDVHTWILEDGEHDKPGRLVGSLGWLVRDWGHPALSRRFLALLQRLDPQPKDPAAFAVWEAEQKSTSELIRILSETGENLPDTDGGVDLAESGRQGHVYEIPMDWLEGTGLNLLFQSGERPAAAIGHAGNLAPHRAVLRVTVDGKPVNIPLQGAALRTIAESSPGQTVDTGRFQFNAGRMNTFATTWNGEGACRWVLARFDLAPLQGLNPESAQLLIPSRDRLTLNPPMDGRDGLDGGDLGAPRVLRLAPLERDWLPAAATWTSRDGKRGWTGGTVDFPARRHALREFLATEPPPKTRATAASLLEALQEM